MTRSGLSACIWAGSVTSQPSQEPGGGMTICLPCRTQVEAFWSKREWKGVTSAKTTSTRRTARTASTASGGWLAAGRLELERHPDAAAEEQRQQGQAEGDDEAERGDEAERRHRQHQRRPPP